MTWDQARLALTLFAIDPAGFGGLWVKARVGPVRGAFQEALKALPHQIQRLHPGMDDDSLLGGVDLTKTLSLGSVHHRIGLLQSGHTGVLTMAERADPAFAARLSQALDHGGLKGLIAFDEGVDADEALATPVTERMAFAIDLNLRHTDVGLLVDFDDIEHVQDRYAGIGLTDGQITTLAGIATQLGVESMRAVQFASRAARAHAADAGRSHATDEDLEAAVALCLAHKATQLPQAAEDDNAVAQDDHQDTGPDPSDEDAIGPLEDRIIDAALALLPEGVLDQIANRSIAVKGMGAGAARRANRRGRPKPSRPGRLGGRARLDLVATLRTAAPWQKLRQSKPGAIAVRPSDFRIKQFEQKSDRLLVFTVDASGSAAIARLAEAKGAIELLLAEAYSRRDHVALISFRGTEAETLLPPTRSLVQTKRRLAALPGGGGTPLAAGLQEALTQTWQARRAGMTPMVVLLTDGRANIALDGEADRPRAAEDARKVARQIRAMGADCLVLDVGKRPADALSNLAHDMGARYIPLPRANAQKVSASVSAALNASQ